MNSHVVLAHPEPKSFNGQLARISQEHLSQDGRRATMSDLYAMDFDPREGPRHYAERVDSTVFHAQTEQRHSADEQSLPADIESEVGRLMDCDLLVVHFPLWWFGPPAMLKGWMDRVFVYGRLYRSTMRYDTGICAGKRMLACVTTGASEDACAHNGREGDTRLHLWPVLYPFRYLGFEVLAPEILHGVGGTAFIEGREGGLSALQDYTSRWATALDTLSSRPPVAYNSDTEFDESKRLVANAPVHSPFIRHRG